MKALFLAALGMCGLLLLGQGAGAGDKGNVVTLGELKSEAPASWKAQKTSNKFRVYQFGVGDAELVVFYFGEGGGGSVNENIKRWKGMFDPPEGKTIDEVSKVETLKLPKAELTYLDVHGTYKFKNPPFDPNAKTERRADHRMFGVVFATEGGPYFIRLTGSQKALEGSKKSFDEWLKNFK